VRWPVLHDYQQQRVCTLLDPTRDPLGKGFHIIQGMIAIGSGGVVGIGLHAGHADPPGVHPERTHRLHLRRVRRGVRPGGQPVPDRLAFIFLILRGLAIAAGGAHAVRPPAGRQRDA